MTTAMEAEPFTIRVPDETLADLRDRLTRTRWPDEFDTDGHFGAMEEPELLADELRAFFRPLR
jgi:hypothetical protein